MYPSFFYKLPHVTHIVISSCLCLVFIVYNIEKRLRDAYEKLKKRGIPLASNQVNYSLIHRVPEENGVKAACDELGVTLIAYAPLAQGKCPHLRLQCMLYKIIYYIILIHPR